MKIKVVKEYISEFPNPLNLKMDETVFIEHLKVNHAGWKFCKTNDNEGWIPESYLDINENHGRLKNNYDANELSLNEGQVLEVLNEESGWYWCKKEDGEFGWYPKEMTKIIKT